MTASNGEQAEARMLWARSLTNLANDFSRANNGSREDLQVHAALAILVTAATKAGL